MKILIICHEFPPLGGGAANATFYLVRHLSSRGHKVTVLTSRFKNMNKSGLMANMIYLPVLRSHIDRASPLELLSFALSGIIYSLFFIRRHKYDICLAIHGIPSGWAAFFIKKAFKIPYMVSLRGADVPGFLPQRFGLMHKCVRPLTDYYWRNAGLLVANSQGLKEISLVTADRIKRKVEVIPNGVDCQVFKPEYSLRNNQAFKILYAGRLTLQKNLKCLITTVRAAYEKGQNSFYLEIIGDGPLKNSLQDISRDLCCKGIINFTGWLDKRELLLRYRQAHIFVLPSFYEGMSNALLEAMACGCMVIATDIAGNNELVKEGKNGFLFEANSPARFQEIFLRALNTSREAIEGMGRASRAIAEDYSWNSVTDAYINRLNKIIAG